MKLNANYIEQLPNDVPERYSCSGNEIQRIFRKMYMNKFSLKETTLSGIDKVTYAIT